MASSIVYNMDCMEYMKSLPDKAFSLAVVDPPYGGGCSQNVQAERDGLRGGSADFEHRNRSRFGGWFDRYHIGIEDGRHADEEVSSAKRSIFSKDIRHWDIAPQQEYFNELARVSENQIIWGGNYFALPPTRCFLVWRKLTISENFTMAMAEYAWTSFNDNAKVFECTPQGTSKWERIHPCEKPVALYAWIYSRYAKPGDRILDTHLGSGSSRIAAWDAGLDFVGVELDKTYFDLEEKRFAEYSAQLRMEDL